MAILTKIFLFIRFPTAEWVRFSIGVLKNAYIIIPFRKICNPVARGTDKGLPIETR